jgi:hypothetical protein
MRLERSFDECPQEIAVRVMIMRTGREQWFAAWGNRYWHADLLDEVLQDQTHVPGDMTDDAAGCTVCRHVEGEPGRRFPISGYSKLKLIWNVHVRQRTNESISIRCIE